MNFQKQLLEFKKLCLKRNIPIISDNTKKFIEKTLINHKPYMCLEIWGAIGFSSIVISNIIKQWGWKLISFEISYPAYKEYLYNINNFWISNINIYNTDFLKTPIQKLLLSKLDFVFLDAQKKDYLNYFKLITPFLNNNCILIFDDIIKFKHKLNNLYLFFEKNQLYYKIFSLDHDDGVIMLQLNHQSLH